MAAFQVLTEGPSGFEFVFWARDCRPLPARTVHFVGDLRRSAGARTPNASLVAYRVSSLGNSYGTASLAVPFDYVGELPGSQGGRGAIPGRISA